MPNRRAVPTIGRALRLPLARLDDTVAADRRQARDANIVIEADKASLSAITKSVETAKRLKLLKEERSEDCSVRQLSPSCCPACEGGSRLPQRRIFAGRQLRSCKNVLPEEDAEADGDRTTDAKHLIAELTRSVEQAKAKPKRSEADAPSKSERLRLAMAEARRVQDQLSTLPAQSPSRVSAGTISARPTPPT